MSEYMGLGTLKLHWHFNMRKIKINVPWLAAFYLALMKKIQVRKKALFNSIWWEISPLNSSKICQLSKKSSKKDFYCWWIDGQGHIPNSDPKVWTLIFIIHLLFMWDHYSTCHFNLTVCFQNWPCYQLS